MRDLIVVLIIIFVVIIGLYSIYHFIVAPIYIPIPQKEEGIAPSVNVPQIPHDTIPDMPQGKG